MNLWLIPAGLLGLLLLLLLVSLVRTLLLPSRKATYEPAPDPERERLYADLLSRMVRYETVSAPDTDLRVKFLGFHRLLEELFPLVHSRLEKIEIDGNLLFHWKGMSDEKPIVLMSHQDVVPAGDGWSHPPFSGDIADGKVWGRGTSDTKCSVMAFLQAVEEMLAEGYTPACDVWLSASCTEEWAGTGCVKLVEELKRRGVRPFLVCDEGGGVIREPMAGIRGHYAMIGVFEKGKADVRFTAVSDGGHTSAPRPHSPVARLADFVHEVESRRVFRRRLPPEAAAMFRTLAPYAPFPLKWVFSNLWLFRPLFLQVLPIISAQAGAMIRTTAAFTMMSGSEACNVIPQKASVCANLRFIPHQGMEESLGILRRIAEKHGLETEVLQAVDYTPSADLDGEAFRIFRETIAETFPGCPYSPYIITGATDARFYQAICESVFRFAPVIYGPEQLKGMHGMNENIETACLPGAVDFYKNLIRAVR